MQEYVLFKLRILDTLPTLFLLGLLTLQIKTSTFSSRHTTVWHNKGSRIFGDYLYGPLKILGYRVLSCKKSTYLVASYSSWSSNYKAIILDPSKQHFETYSTFFVEENIFYISCKKPWDDLVHGKHFINVIPLEFWSFHTGSKSCAIFIQITISRLNS